MDSNIIMIYINFCKCLFNNNTILNCVDLNFNYDFKTFFYLVE